MGPLSGIRILDLSSVIFGPLATQTLGDLGADVIKIEGADGDTTRYTGPSRTEAMAALFLGVNRNKRSLVLDLKQRSARDALWRLIDSADVFIHSIRPQKIEKLGFSPEAVLERNPRIVYAGLYGYRSGGPYSGQPAYDDIIQGQSGAADLMARLVGEPRYTPAIIADKTCALVATYSVTAALLARERTGKGQFVEIPMFESMAAFNLAEHLFGHSFEPPLDQIGYTRVLAPWRRPYHTKDGYLCMLAYTDQQWRKFWTAVDRAELIDDPRFKTMANRSKNIAELYQLAGECLADRPTDEWLEILRELEIPCARINELENLEKDPHLQAVDFFKKAQHPTEGDIVMTDIPVRFSEDKAGINRLQPKLGEHSVEVLREAGLSEQEIAVLIESKATQDGNNQR